MTHTIAVPEHLKPYLMPVFDRKAMSVTALQVSSLTSYTDVLVIVEAASHRQATSIAQHITKTLKASGITAIGTEGIKEGEWALLDYGDIVIHIFETRARAFYDLEGFWADAPAYDLSGINAGRTGEPS